MNTIKKARLTKYLDEANGAIGWLLSVSSVSNLLELAIKDGIQELYVTKEEYDIIRLSLLYNGAWNWDGATIMGMKLIVI